MPVAALALDLDHRDRVHARERFVEQHEARVCGQRARDLHAPAFAARQRQRRVLAQLLDLQLGQQVDDEIANRISAQLLLLAAQDPDRDITLYINSPGGSVTAGMAIYDTMQYIPNDVVTVATGLAASMGQFLLASGTKGKRYATPHARVLMHQPSGGIGGTESDIRIQAQLILHMKQVMAELTAEQTGQSVETILEDNARDKWFTAQEALKYGFIDHIADRAASVTGGGGVRG